MKEYIKELQVLIFEFIPSIQSLRPQFEFNIEN